MLEAISYLGYGRSFRDARYQSLIREDQPYFAISADVIRDSTDLSDRIGVCRYRNRNQSLEISINSNKSTRLVDLVDKISVQVIHPQGIDLILGGPESVSYTHLTKNYSFNRLQNKDGYQSLVDTLKIGFESLSEEIANDLSMIK